MFKWFENHRRREILSHPFPPEWEAYISRNMTHWGMLSEDERVEMRQLVQVFVADKNWVGCGGLEMDDEIRSTIAAEACLLLLGQEHQVYKNVETILVYPSTVRLPPRPPPMFPSAVQIEDDEGAAILGEAVMNGPTILVWDAVKCGGIHPERGHNVVYHEFAHKLDMLDGQVSGTPTLPNRQAVREWIMVCQREFESLKTRSAAGFDTFLDPYGATNVGEFFAVATEYFFDKPIAMEEGHEELYGVLADFYGQDPAARARAAGGEPERPTHPHWMSSSSHGQHHGHTH